MVNRTVAAAIAALLLAYAPPAWAQFDSEPRTESGRSRPARGSRRSAGGEEYRISKDTVVGAAALAVPGGAFLLWTDPALDHRYIGPGSGILLAVAFAALGFKSYVDGDVLQGLALHGGSILGGFAGYRYAASHPDSGRAARPSSPGIFVAATIRF